MRRTVLVVVLLTVIACGKKHGADTGSGEPSGGSGGSNGSNGSAAAGDCDGVAAHLTELQMADLPSDLPPETKQQVAATSTRVKTAVASTCRDTKWSAEAIACFLALDSARDGDRCEAKLTSAQRDAVDVATNAAQEATAEDKASALRGITALRDKMCACKDAACGKAVYEEWGDVEHASELARHDETTKVAWNTIDDELMACLAELK